jgi:hypothetical protein
MLGKKLHCDFSLIQVPEPARFTTRIHSLSTFNGHPAYIPGRTSKHHRSPPRDIFPTLTNIHSSGIFSFDFPTTVPSTRHASLSRKFIHNGRQAAYCIHSLQLLPDVRLASKARHCTVTIYPDTFAFGFSRRPVTIIPPPFADIHTSDNFNSTCFRRPRKLFISSHLRIFNLGIKSTRRSDSLFISLSLIKLYRPDKFAFDSYLLTIRHIVCHLPANPLTFLVTFPRNHLLSLFSITAPSRQLLSKRVLQNPHPRP